jgi:hypothetical protein
VTNNKKFELLEKFIFMVPFSYDHENQLNYWWVENRHTGKISIDWVFIRGYFIGTTNALLPWRLYRVKVFRITEKTSYSEVMEFLRNNKALFVSAQGLTLLQSTRPHIFPENIHLMSLDELSALPDYKWLCKGVPYIIRRQNDYWESGAHILQDGSWLPEGTHILCVSK